MSKAPESFDTAFDTYTASRSVVEGGAGIVFAVGNSTGETFALKCLHPLRTDTQKRKRFQNEIEFCAKHPHRNLIKVLGSGSVTWDGVKCPFYVMPLYPKTLRSLMDVKISPLEVLPLYTHILDGVDVDPGCSRRRYHPWRRRGGAR
jgi:serine/threonine protein kinase